MERQMLVNNQNLYEKKKNIKGYETGQVQGQGDGDGEVEVLETTNRKVIIFFHFNIHSLQTHESRKKLIKQLRQNVRKGL